jgi:hypothetical protein
LSAISYFDAPATLFASTVVAVVLRSSRKPSYDAGGP